MMLMTGVFSDDLCDNNCMSLFLSILDSLNSLIVGANSLADERGSAKEGTSRCPLYAVSASVLIPLSVRDQDTGRLAGIPHFTLLPKKEMSRKKKPR